MTSINGYVLRQHIANPQSLRQLPIMLRGIFLAIAAGTAAGTAFPVIILSMAILGSSPSRSDFESAIWIAMLAIAFPFALVTSSTLLLGFPATLALKKFNLESETAYLLVGGALGFLVPGAVLTCVEGSGEFFFAATTAGIFGAFSGAITGRTWWRQYRALSVGAEK